MIVMRRITLFRRGVTGIDLLAAAAIVTVAFALAGLVWRMAGHAGTGAITIPSGARMPAQVVTDTGPIVALAPFGRASLTDAGSPTGIQAQLRGVIAAVPAEASTAFVSIGAEPARPYRVGEVLAGATIEAILRDRVILNNGGRIEYLAFPDPFAAPVDPNAASPAAAAASPSPVAAPPPPSPSPAASAAQAVIDRLGATQVGGGYSVGANAPPGMRAGDVIQSVNGTALSDRASIDAAIANAAEGQPARVTILRDGRPITVTVPIR